MTLYGEKDNYGYYTVSDCNDSHVNDNDVSWHYRHANDRLGTA